MKKYICLVCGHIELREKPEVCPICFAGPHEFVEMCKENEHLYAHFSDIL
ncbi:rubredoxin-like domain-containing protein [Helicovermis profundi]|uniref:Rubrerythrin rubredoxin-like domain-containing protein n=1 Tax=Helicovermis profundi TaxID=3065157 RepID=A0AAU9ET23_9FIRM|nr:hypothetical protein HLPR_05360 [Clostridia bacterium S502]